MDPPKTRYQESELLDYLTTINDEFLESNAHSAVICGGDLNKLNVDLLQTLSGLDPLVNFPTRGNSILDNCSTNRVDLFSKPFPLHTQIKTDHIGDILPAGQKMKPNRIKYTLRDRREHRKIAFNRARKSRLVGGTKFKGHSGSRR